MMNLVKENIFRICARWNEKRLLLWIVSEIHPKQKVRNSQEFMSKRIFSKENSEPTKHLVVDKNMVYWQCLICCCLINFLLNIFCSVFSTYLVILRGYPGSALRKHSSSSYSVDHMWCRVSNLGYYHSSPWISFIFYSKYDSLLAQFLWCVYVLISGHFILTFL